MKRFNVSISRLREAEVDEGFCEFCGRVGKPLSYWLKKTGTSKDQLCDDDSSLKMNTMLCKECWEDTFDMIGYKPSNKKAERVRVGDWLEYDFAKKFPELSVDGFLDFAYKFNGVDLYDEDTVFYDTELYAVAYDYEDYVNA